MNNQVFCKKCGAICIEREDGGILRQQCPECGFIYYQNPFPCISVLVVDESNRVLLGLRGEESIYSKKWCLPCGYIEYEETYVEAAHRETMEETGIAINPQGIINVVSNQFENGVNSMVVTILATPETLDVIPGDDIVEARWFSLEESLPELAFQADRYIIDKYRKAKEQHLEMKCLGLMGTSF